MAGQRNNRQSSGGFSMDDYVDVAQRMVEFRTKHPEGTVQPSDLARPYTVETVANPNTGKPETYIVVVAAAYRTPDDTRPGIGMAWEPFPGKTPYTRDSELQNAETSAWGRAIMAVQAADARKGISTSQEVRNRVADREAEQQPEQPRPVVTDAQVADMVARVVICTQEGNEVPGLRECWQEGNALGVLDRTVEHPWTGKPIKVGALILECRTTWMGVSPDDQPGPEEAEAPAAEPETGSGDPS